MCRLILINLHTVPGLLQTSTKRDKRQTATLAHTMAHVIGAAAARVGSLANLCTVNKWKLCKLDCATLLTHMC